MKLNNNDDSHNSGLNLLIYNMLLDIESHPAWVCGLKRIHSHKHSCIYSHTLRGCVDWNSNTWCAITHHQSHTLRGCVDWNRCISCGLIKPISHTLRGCVDWNWQPYWSGCQSMVTPCVGVWIETSNSVQTGWPISSHPAWVYMDWSIVHSLVKFMEEL